MEKDTVEHRKAKRIQDFISVKLHKKNQKFIAVLCKNISTKGICIECTEKFNIGDEFLFEIFLSNGKILKTKGKLVWSSFKENKYYYGVKFLKINILNKIKLIKFINILIKNSLTSK